MRANFQVFSRVCAAPLVFSGMCAAALVPCAGAATSPPALGAGGDTAKLHAMFDEYWAWTKRESPEFATLLGDDRYNDRLTDLSQAAVARRKTYVSALLGQRITLWIDREMRRADNARDAASRAH